MMYFVTIFKLQLKLIVELHKRAGNGIVGYFKNKFCTLLMLQKVFLILFCVSKILLFLVVFFVVFCFYHIELIRKIYLQNKRSGFIGFARKNRVFFSLIFWRILYSASLCFLLFVDLMLSVLIWVC